MYRLYYVKKYNLSIESRKTTKLQGMLLITRYAPKMKWKLLLDSYCIPLSFIFN